MHLIAHEVAHTQQQLGGTPQRQHKLEVSTPGDALEREADHAADAMVAGLPVSVGGGGGLARKVYRDELGVPAGPDETAYTKTRDAGAVAEHYKEEQLKQAGPAHSGDSMSYLGANNIGDRGQAMNLANRISGYTATLGESGDTAKLDANMAALGALKEYVSASSDQNRAQSMFGPEMVQCQLDSERLSAMFKTHLAEAGVSDAGSSTGTSLAKQMMVAGTGKSTGDADGMQNMMQAQGVSSDLLKNDKLTTCKQKIRTLQDSLGGYGPAMSQAVAEVLAQSKAMGAAVKECQLPPVKRDATDAEKQAAEEVTGVKNDLAAAVTTANAIVGIAKEGINAIPGGAAVTGAAGKGVGLYENAKTIGESAVRDAGTELKKGNLTEDIVKYMSDYDAAIKRAEGKVSALQTDEARKAASVAVAKVRAAEAVFNAAVKGYRHNRAEIERVKTALRQEVDTLNTLVPAKTPGQANLGQMVGLQSEAAIFLARCDATIKIGEQERTESQRAKDAKGKAAGDGPYKKLDPDAHFGELIAERRGLSYYEARKYKDMSGWGGTGGYYFKFDEGQVTFTMTPKTQKTTQESMDSSMDQKLDALGKMHAEMSLFVSQMRKMTGI
jgi:hypothetical protein